MLDITKCKGYKCPIKDSCHRFTVKLDEFNQSYFNEIPFNSEIDECEYFIDNSEYIEKEESYDDLTKTN